MVNIAVIGCGYWGPNLIRNLSEIKNVRIKACCDIRKERLDYIKQRYPFLETATDYNILLKDPDIDAICIATPILTHFQIAKEVLLNNKHVLIEKPMTASSIQAEKLIDLAKRQKRILMVGHTFEYSGAVNKIKEIIAKGEIGKVLYFDSTRLNSGQFPNDTNVIWDLAAHDISILLYIFSLMPLNISAIGRSFIKPGIKDTAYLILNFPHKIIAHIHVSWLAPIKYRKTIIVGRKNMIIYDDTENKDKIKIFNNRAGDVINPKIDTTEPLRRECLHFIDCIVEEKQPITDGKSGLCIAKILEAAERSLKNRNRPEKIF